MMRYTTIETPIGEMTLQANEFGLTGAWFETQTTLPTDLGERSEADKILVLAKQQLEEYFSGRRKNFDLPLAANGTEFQQQVWTALCDIPYGATYFYQQLAQAIDNPNAVRAVGLANGKNPISIIVPCHRVIGKNGTLTGYAGGVERKEWLLKHEQAS